VRFFQDNFKASGNIWVPTLCKADIGPSPP
jgi:hypothetical protein